MNQRGSISHYFPGANTPQGFYSLYDQIARVDANKIFVIKGGPGVGKSTFMKAIANSLLDQGYDVELHHCSADNNSIDAVYIPAGDVALLDGTAPHVVDPKNPGAVDEIIHLGDYWSEAGLRGNREQILACNQACTFRFQRANDALRAARAFRDEWAAYHQECLDLGQVYAASEELIATLVPQRREKRGRLRRLFASAITYDGAKHWLSNIFDGCTKRVIIQGPPGSGKSVILGRLAETALARGYDLDQFHCPMRPDRIDHLRLPESGVGLISSFWPHEYTPHPGDQVIETTAFLDQERLARYTTELVGVEEAYRSAIAREMYQLAMAKRTHDELERYYVPHMDFGAIEQRRKQTLERILELIAEHQAIR